MSLQRVVDVVDDRDILDVVERFTLQQAGLAQQIFQLLGADFGEVGRALLLVDLVVFFGQKRDVGIDRRVEVGTIVQRAGNDQRRARLVDEDRVHFVDDRVIVAALNHLAALVFHVVAQIIEAEFVICRVGDVAGVSRAALLVVQAVDNDAGRKTEEAVKTAHDAGVALGEVVVDGNDMDALARQGVEIDRQGADQRLAFTGLHFGDRAVMQDHAAGQLNVEGPHSEHAAGSFARHGKGRDHDVFERLAIRQHLAKLNRLVGELFVGQRLGRFLYGIDLGESRLVAANAALVGRTEQFAGDAAEADHANGPF
ncbi:hypothetical protein D3C80_962600 [compost metagenome]